MALVAVTTEISPELVLVSPELAERARAELPDRPWEALLPALRPAVYRPPPLRPEAQAATSWPGRLIAAVPMILIAVFTVVIVVGTLPWLTDRPTLGPVEPSPKPPTATTSLLPTFTVINPHEERIPRHVVTPR
jgi:hypothetical protein